LFLSGPVLEHLNAGLSRDQSAFTVLRTGVGTTLAITSRILDQ